MKPFHSAKTLWWGMGLIVLGLAGISTFPLSGPATAPFSGWGYGGFYDRGSYASNGERIYFLGLDGEGSRIAIRGGPPWLKAMGGSCVNCHGPDGRGGFPVMMGTRVAGDIRFSSLSSGRHGQVGDEGDHGDLYTEEDFKRAIRDGVDPDGGRLDPTMPRWKMDDRDLDDLIVFLKTLG